MLSQHTIQKHQDGNLKCCFYYDFKHQVWAKLRFHIDLNHPENDEKRYFCELCGSGFIFEDICRRHQLYGHKNNVCNICNIDCKDKDSLKAHFLSEHKASEEMKDKSFQCDYCFLQCSSEGILRKHRKEAHQKGYQVRCLYCDYKGPSWNKAMYHIDFRHPSKGEKKHFCEICNEGFIYKESQIIHKNIKHKTNVCNICKIDCKDQESLKTHFLEEHKPTEENIYVCDYCFLNCGSNEEMEREHKIEKHQNGNKTGKICCLYCNYKGASYCSTKYHIDNNHPEQAKKHHFCDICNKGFIYKQSCITHKRNKHQRYYCDICGNDYSCKSNVKDHIVKDHQDVIETIDLVCEICAFSTPSKKTLQHHISRRHAIDKHEKCPHCTYHSSELKRIHIHIDSKHPDHDQKKFFCDHCSRSFIFEASLKKHLENQRTIARNRAKKMRA